ncbi:MAG TPA: ferritin family protein [Candidatus Deferrimicrobiaceae bacterium]|nr:ferritin family protein [Candidatus Deferrimicrobiaceae bacterium]
MKKGPAKPTSGSIAEGWKKALRNEIEGREFYRMAAANASLDGVRQMFTFLMEEEERHRDAILEQIGRMERGRPPRLVRKASGKREIRKFRSPLFPPEFVAQGKKVEGEAAALSIGMTLERRAIEQFSALRKKVEGDEAAEKIFDSLIAWEREHLEILSRQYEQLREMYWEEARFWPF